MNEKSLIAKCKRLGYTLEETAPGEYKLTPIKRGFVLYFHNQAELLVWLQVETETASNNYYLM